MYRPVSVTIFGVLNLIIGGLSTCIVAFGIVNVLSGAAELQPPANPISAALNDSLLFIVYYRTLAVTSLLAWIVCTISGIGLLAIRQWGRKLAIAYAAYSLVSVALLLIVLVWAASRAERGQMSLPYLIEIGFSLLPTVLHAGLLWYFMTRPHVIAAFERRGSPFLLGPGGASPFHTQEDVPPGPSGDNPFAAPPSID